MAAETLVPSSADEAVRALRRRRGHHRVRRRHDPDARDRRRPAEAGSAPCCCTAAGSTSSEPTATSSGSARWCPVAALADGDGLLARFAAQIGRPRGARGRHGRRQPLRAARPRRAARRSRRAADRARRAGALGPARAASAPSPSRTSSPATGRAGSCWRSSTTSPRARGRRRRCAAVTRTPTRSRTSRPARPATDFASASSGVGPSAVRARTVEQSRNAEDVLKDVDPVDDAVATAEYRRKMLLVLIASRTRGSGELMTLTVNGIEHEITSPPLTALLHVLREELEIMSPKAGCQQGGCGTCTVLVDGEPRRSCLTAVATVDGAAITTLEGLGQAEALSPVQAAFHDPLRRAVRLLHARVIVAATALIERKGGAVERDEVLEALGGHYCRCTGYVKIVDAVMAASRGEVEPVADLPAAERGRARRARQGQPRMKAVGARLPRYDGVGHVTGRTQYVDDVRVGRTLWVKALRSPHHHAAITKPRHVEGRGDEGRARDHHARRRAAERLRAPGGARRSRRRAAARRRRGSLQGPADRRGRGRVGGGRAGGRRGDRDRVRGEAGALRHPARARSRSAADPPLGQRLSALRPVQPPPRAQGRHRLGVRAGRHDRRGRLPPAGDRADAAGDAGRASRSPRRAAG